MTYNSVPPRQTILSTARPRVLSTVIEKLASIHDGKKGQTIPDEVMALYRAVNARDRFRPRMLRIIVPTLRSSVRAGIMASEDLLDIVRKELVEAAHRLPAQRLEDWLAAEERRSAYIPMIPDRTSALRQGYVAEALQIAADVLDYAEALCA
jgi:hypothetical protein